MKMRVAGLLLLCAACSVTAVRADEPSKDMGSMDMTKPGAESAAIAKFFAGTATWNGKVSAGAMGQNSPEMTSKGQAVGKQILGGWWYATDVQDMVGTGKDAMTWKGHMVVGWDGGAKAYKAYSVDNLGSSAAWTGTLDGDKFVLETDQPVMQMGMSMKDRLTWVLNGDGTANFTDEHQMAGSSDWVMFESGLCKMSGAPKGTKKKSM